MKLDNWPNCCYCDKPLNSWHHAARMCKACKKGRKYAIAYAIQQVQQAIKYGEIPPVSTLKCVDCGAPAAVYDHRDYARPLDVQPVCISCNSVRGPATWNADDLLSFHNPFKNNTI